MFPFLPTTPAEMTAKGWSGLDVLLITGDAYIDHPSYGAAVIGRVLESHGYKTGIISQPDWRNTVDFTRMGRPSLFVGITAGNLDSMVSNYTSHKKPRTKDDFSPDGKIGLRPDRATIVYANRIREAFGSIPIVIGGIEASLRRLAHYDWWDNKVRRSILLDAKANILVYGMGEKQIIEIAKRIRTGQDISNLPETLSNLPDKLSGLPETLSGLTDKLSGISGTVITAKKGSLPNEAVELPSFEEVGSSHRAFNRAFRLIMENQDPVSGKPLAQPHGDRVVLQYPPSLPLSEKEMDAVYGLPYMRKPHASYEKHPVPGFETVKFSIISHRGCVGNCSFCSLTMHQGRIIQSRSIESINKEAVALTAIANFKGTITDIGGPTVNLFKASCSRWLTKGACPHRDCLTPEKCPNLVLGYSDAMKLLESVRNLPKVKHVFLESGLRYDLLVQPEARKYLEAVCRHHVSGRMKVAPEHYSPEVLALMNKPSFEVYEQFRNRFNETNKHIGKSQFLVNYFISAHPGATIEDEKELARYLKAHRMRPEQIQDFTPLPMTASAAMYYTEMHPVTGQKLHVAKTFRDRKLHRAIIQKG
jgi:uncharacterized radical SAM protein YgiQ